ncbi:hypothetical protein GTV15_19145 [Streptomyces sp. SID7803]|nr:hypothetical protein [Streptomyces sp. SID7803]
MEQSDEPTLGVTEIMGVIAEKWGKKYAPPNLRETLRKQTLHQFVDAGFAEHNSDAPEGRAVNSSKNNYRIAPAALSVVRLFGTPGFQDTVDAWVAEALTQQAAYQATREMQMLPVTLPNGSLFQLSHGGQNPGCGPLHFCTRDAPLWTTYTATASGVARRWGMMWDLVHWDDCAIELEWVVVEVGCKSVLRRLTKDGGRQRDHLRRPGGHGRFAGSAGAAGDVEGPAGGTCGWNRDWCSRVTGTCSAGTLSCREGHRTPARSGALAKHPNAIGGCRIVSASMTGGTARSRTASMQVRTCGGERQRSPSLPPGLHDVAVRAAAS